MTDLKSIGLNAAVAFCICAPSQADLIYGNFDATTQFNGSIGFFENQPAIEYEVAIQFTAPLSFMLESAVLPVHSISTGLFPPPPPGSVFGNSMQVAMYADDNGVPGALLELIHAPDSLEDWTSGVGDPFPSPVTVAFSGTTLLDAGQSYWLGLIETEGTALFWCEAPTLTPHARRARFAGGDQWGSSSPTRRGFQIHGTAVPGPGVLAAMLLHGWLLGGRRRAARGHNSPAGNLP